MLIDTDREWCLRVENVLRMNGMPTSSAHDGASGVRIARAEIPRIVICEWDLPDMHAFDVVTCLRLDRMTSWIPVIITSTNVSSERQVASLAAGANALVRRKDLEFDIVRSVVRAMLT